MNKLDKLVCGLQNNHVFIQTHNYPDQDALACAKGMQMLLAARGKSSSICYNGHIDKYNTIKTIELLDINIYPTESIIMTKADEIILVDCQKGNSNVKDFIGQEVVCIDHHKEQDTSDYSFFDIRSSVGACSTIITEYFLENSIPIDTKMATALLYGIKIDTANLSRGICDLDIDMYCYLLKKADRNILRQLEGCNLKMKDLEAYKQAISDLRIYGGIGLANIGRDCSEGLIGSIADFLLSLNEVSFTLVHSYRNGGLKFSVRSENEEIDSSLVIKNILRGYGDGGGHATMAAGFIPNILYNDSHSIADIIEERLVDMFL